MTDLDTLKCAVDKLVQITEGLESRIKALETAQDPNRYNDLEVESGVEYKDWIKNRDDKEGGVYVCRCGYTSWEYSAIVKHICASHTGEHFCSELVEHDEIYQNIVKGHTDGQLSGHEAEIGT